MALKLNFYLDSAFIKEPLNYGETSIQIRKDTDNPDFSGEVSVNSWTFGLGDSQDPQDAVQIIKQHLVNYGGLEGIPYWIDLQNGSSVERIYNGYIDPSTASYLCDAIEAESSESKGKDWLNEVASSVDFEKLFDDKIITDDDFVKVPYDILVQENRLDTVILLLTVYSIYLQILSAVRSIIASINGLIGSVGFGWEQVFIILELISALFQIVLALFTLFQTVSKFLLPPVKYKAGMYLMDLCTIAANELGYEFRSTILDGTNTDFRISGGDYDVGFGGRFTVSDPSSVGFDNVIIIPESYNQFEDEDGNLGVFDIRATDQELKGFYRGSFADLLVELKKMFNGKLIFEKDGNTEVLRLERRDYVNNSSPLYTIPPIDRTDSPFKYNSEALKSNYQINFIADDNDKNPWLQYQGTAIKVLTTFYRSKGNQLLKGEEINDISFALASIKTELTKQEKLIKGIASTYYAVLNIYFSLLRALARVINGLIKAINKILKVLKTAGILKEKIKIVSIDVGSIRNPLQDFRDRFDEKRLNTLVMENHFISKPKLLVLEKNYKYGRQDSYKMSIKNRQLLNAEFLYDKFHYIDSFDGVDNNQRIIYSLENIPFSCEDYEKVRNNDVLRDYDGKDAELISLEWNPTAQTANIEFAKKEKWTNNITTKKYFTDGR